MPLRSLLMLTSSAPLSLRPLPVPEALRDVPLGGWFSLFGRAFLVAGGFGGAPDTSVSAVFLLAEVLVTILFVVGEL